MGTFESFLNQLLSLRCLRILSNSKSKSLLKTLVSSISDLCLYSLPFIHSFVLLGFIQSIVCIVYLQYNKKNICQLQLLLLILQLLLFILKYFYKGISRASQVISIGSIYKSNTCLQIQIYIQFNEYHTLSSFIIIYIQFNEYHTLSSFHFYLHLTLMSLTFPFVFAFDTHVLTLNLYLLI